MRTYAPPLSPLPVSSPIRTIDRAILAESRYCLAQPLRPDFSFCEAWPLAVKGCVYAMYYSPSPDGQRVDDTLGFVYLADLLCTMYGIESPIWPFSIADTIRGIERLYPREPEYGIANIHTPLSDQLDAFGLPTPDARAFEGASVIPTYPCAKTWIACGVPLIAGIAVSDDWERGAQEGYHGRRQKLERCDADTANVVVVVGWDDSDSTFTIRYLDSDRKRENLYGKIDVTEVLGAHSRIELCALYAIT